MKKIFTIICTSLLLFSCQIQDIDKTTTIKEFIQKSMKPAENFFAVIPHHSLVKDEIDEYYKYLSETYSGSKIDNIVVISPNHFNFNGLLAETIPEDSILCFQKNCIEAYTFNSIEKKIHFFAPVFKTQLNNTTPIPQPLSPSQGEREKNTYFTQEHGIGEHIFFIKKYFPNAKFYPLVINREFKNIANSANEITKILENEFGILKDTKLPPTPLIEGGKKGSTLFIASVDFSHHVKEEFAIEHDKRSVASLSYGDLEGVEVDCPNCLQTIYNLANNSGKNCFNEYKRTSVDLVLNIESGTENTSHIYGDYETCENPKTTPITGIIFGKYNSFEDLSIFYEEGKTEKDPRFYYHTPLNGFDIVATTSEKTNDLSIFPIDYFINQNEVKIFQDIRGKNVVFYSFDEDDYSEEILEDLKLLKDDNTIIAFVYRKTLENDFMLYELAEVADMVIGVPKEDAEFDVYKFGEVEEYNESMIYHSIGNVDNYVIFEVN